MKKGNSPIETWVIRCVYLCLMIAGLAVPVHAQYLTVSGSQLTDSSGNAISNATLTFAPVLSNGSPASFRKGTTGGQAVVTPVTANVTSGAFSLQVVDTSQTMPVNMCYAVTVTDNVTGNSLLGSGYGCVQPASTVTSWCTATTCNFDAYQPNLAALALIQTGPQGPQGATGPQGPQGPSGNLVAGVPETQTGSDALCTSGSGVNFECITNIVNFSQASSSTGIGERDWMDTTYNRWGPGSSLGNDGGWSVAKISNQIMTSAQRGITQANGLQMYKHAVGDTMGHYDYVYSDGGVTALSDEAVKGYALDSGETSGYYHGTVTGISGSGYYVTPTLSAATSGNNWTTDGAYLLDISKGTISGNLNGGGGTEPSSNILYQSTTGSHLDQYNYIIVLAGHECDSIQNLYLDGRQVFWDTSSPYGNVTRNGVNFGGNANSNTYYGPDGVAYNFGGAVYCEARFGDQSAGDYITTVSGNDPNWVPSASGTPSCMGCTYVYLKIEYNTNLFPNAPEIRFTINGKNTILDPRTGTTGFTSNWALIVADVITDPIFGLGDNAVNQEQLIAAANVCDEQVALAEGGTEARYALNYHYDTSVGPGDVLATMMDGAAGRLSRINGEWYIWPAYWQGPSFTFDQNALTGSYQWSSKRKQRDLINCVNGTYIAPTYPYNIAGNLYDQNGYYNWQIQNNFPFAFQPTNYPQYACDTLHGYASNQYLTEDLGIVLPKELGLSTVLSVAQAQRIAKITLLRNRWQGSGSFTMNLAAWSMQPLDVMQFTFSAMGWSEKSLEVVGVDFRISDNGGGSVQSVGCTVHVQETDPTAYEWSTTEELSVYDIPVTPTQAPYTPAPPTDMALISTADTALTAPDGTVTPRIEVTWNTPLDGFVTQILVQYQETSATTWVQGPLVNVSLNSAYISPIVAGEAYNVQIASVRPNGAMSAWVQILDFTTGIAMSSFAGLAPIVSPSFTGTVVQSTPSQLTSAVTAQSATAGSASVLPATPLGYLEMEINNVTCKVPYYSP
jgi:hypothetical protein